MELKDAEILYSFIQKNKKTCGLSEKSNKQWLIQEMEEKFDEIGLF
jgi:hypothetical protein